MHKKQAPKLLIFNRKSLALLIILALYAVINFSWNSAALAWIATGQDCPADLVQTAKQRVENRLGKINSYPVLLCNPTPGLGVEYGTTRFTPLFPTIIILGAKGINIDVAAHEIAHAAIAEQTGIIKRLLKVPTWFDEGLAMQFDDRHQYSRKALWISLKQAGHPKLSLNDLSKHKGFFTNSPNLRLHYAYAKCVVGRWLTTNSNRQPQQLLKNISAGMKFPIQDFEIPANACLISPEDNAQIGS